jgi:hypothetical protein
MEEGIYECPGEAYPRVAPYGTPLCNSLALPINIRLGWEWQWLAYYKAKFIAVVKYRPIVGLPVSPLSPQQV